jgi:hypothetical protein
MQGGPKVLPYRRFRELSEMIHQLTRIYLDMLSRVIMRTCNLAIHCSSASENTRIWIAFKNILTAEIALLSDLNFFLSRSLFKYQNKKKAQDAKFEEYGDRGNLVNTPSSIL